MSSITMFLHTHSLTKAYGRHLALDDLNLALPAGEIFGLLGPNGSGKSTTLRLLMGFLRPTRGRAEIGGHDCWRESLAARRLVSYLPGELRLYENLTGSQFLRFLAGLRGRNGHQARGDGVRAAGLARRFDIDLSRPIASLSSGMKRKLALLAVLLPRSPLLILDEPTNTLDPTMRAELLDQLLEARRDHGQTILFSSHVLHEVERVCDRVGILCRGRLVHVQPMAGLLGSRRARVRFRPGYRPPPEMAEAKNLPPGVELAADGNGAAASRMAVKNPGSAELTLLCHGDDLRPFLTWLTAFPVADLRLEPLGLAEIYRRYHGDEQGRPENEAQGGNVA
jgi:ABC-2 type transport system ATP-binding protein